MPRRGEPVLTAMREYEGTAAQTTGKEHCVVRNAAKSKDHTYARQRLKLRRQVSVAGTNLLGQGLVRRRQALDRIRNAGVEKHEPIVDGHGRRCTGKAELKKSFVQ